MTKGRSIGTFCADTTGQIGTRVFRFDHHIKAVHQGCDDCIRALVLIVCSGKKAIFAVYYCVIEICPVATVNAV